MVCDPRLGNVVLGGSDVRGKRGFEGSVVFTDHPFVS